LRPGLAQAENALSLHVSRERDYTRAERSRRGVSLMRKYEIAALLPDLTIAFRQHVAPATPVFEECASGFARGTLIRTVNGDVAIEDLLPGDMIHTVDNGFQTLKWKGSMMMIPNAEGLSVDRQQLTRIGADSFGFAKPHQDIILGPAARKFHQTAFVREITGRDGAFVPVSDFVDGGSTVHIRPVSPVQVFHLGLMGQERILANGMEFESYHPGPNMRFDLRGEMLNLFLSMFPHIAELSDYGLMTHPRLRLQDMDMRDSA
ncbi:MAG: hypothetical protein EBT13_11615, partial [Rhodobacteraceae bacterium]|nr:hypothetical protein [Paracoccaceae bacterium]